MDALFRAPRGLEGGMEAPADKSITHRALMLAGVSNGRCRIRNPLATGDCVSTRRCLEALGVPIEQADGGLLVQGVGLRGLREPVGPLDAENSGTTTRLLSGLLAGQRLFAVVTGDGSLRRRPMARVVEPLRAMGARVEGREGGRFAPLCYLPGTGDLLPGSHRLAVASAQVKGCLLFAGLRASAPSHVSGATVSRDHSERMLGALGVRIEEREGEMTVHPPSSLPAFDTRIPGDVSSAAFFIAASVLSGRRLAVRRCGLNPTRLGFPSVVGRMGARVIQEVEETSLGEPLGTLQVDAGELRGTSVPAAEIPELIDEVPLIAVLGLFARGRTEVRGAGELRYKESDRLRAIAEMADALGGRIQIQEDGFSVEGPQDLRGGVVDPHGDHRIAMAAAVAGVRVREGVRVLGFECAEVSYPDFIRDYRGLGGIVE